MAFSVPSYFWPLTPAHVGDRCHLDLAGAGQPGAALVDIDFVLAHQELHALDQPVADLAAALLRDLIVELQVLE